MRKRIFAMLVALIMAISLFPVTALAATAETVYNNADAALKATGVAATKTVTANGDGTYTITLSVTGKTDTETITQNLPADVVLVVDTSTSMDDTVSRTTCGGHVSRIENPDFIGPKYVCDQCGTEYYLKPINDICSEWIRTNRLDVAKSAAHQFVTGLLGASNNIRIGLYDFSGSNRTDLGLTRDETTLHNAIDALDMPRDYFGWPDGDGTNYNLGLSGAESILNSSESERAKFIVFLSDGEPTKGNGVGTADQLKGSGVTIFTVGIDVDNNAANALRAISSRTPTDGYYYYTASSSGSSGTALNDVLAQIQKEIESMIPAGTNAVMTDFINTDSFEYVSADSGLTYNAADGRLTWNIGDLTDKRQTVTFTVKLKDSNTAFGQLPTNKNVELTFIAPNGDFVKFTEGAIGKPKVEVYKVTYTDGVSDEEVFADRVFYNLRSGKETPAFGDDPTREGYKFTGWDPDFADTISGSVYDIVYTAQWEECEAPTTYTVSYSVSGDVPADYTAPANASVAHGADYTVAAVPALQEGTKDGVSGTYSFDGWYDGQNKVTALTNVTGSKTLTGTWTFTEAANPTLVYVYAKFENSAGQQIEVLPLNASSLELNEHGWLTLGYVRVDGTVTEEAAVAELSKTNGFFRYTDNAAFDLSLVSSSSWTLTQAYGADDYVESGTCYHLDGVIPVYQVTYDANGGAGAPDADQYLLPDTEHPLNSTTKPTHEKVNNVDVVFIGWMNSNNNEKVYVKGDAAPETIKKVDIVNQDVTVYAAWGADTNNNDIADVLETKYTVTYNDGVENKEVFEDQVYNDLLVGDDTPAFDGTPTRPGYRFVGWTPEWSETVTDNVIYTAQWCRSYHHTTSTEAKPTLNKADHYAYVVGYPDGTVQPQGAITRAEVATIFFRLLSDETRDQYWTKSNGYTDVSSGNWFNNAVSTLSNAGIINGYPDGTFRPNAPITRAEMAKVIAMFAELDKDSEGFKDIAGHWAEAYIKLAAGNGWIAGYPDGTFRPNQYITRAETMTMINRVLERVPSEEEHLLSRRVMLTFPDNQPGDWYYIAVQEATNSHTYERYATEKNGDEQWIKLIDNYDWTKLEF